MEKKKGSLVQKRQHKYGRGGKSIGAKLVVCLGEESYISQKQGGLNSLYSGQLEIL